MSGDPVQTPAGFTPQMAIATGEIDEPAVAVSTKNPLPTMPMGADMVFSMPSSQAGLNVSVAKKYPGRLFSIIGNNNRSNTVHLKFYDTASTPDVGTDKPLMTVALAAQSQFSHRFDGLRFTKGIAFAFTGGVKREDTVPIAEDDIEAFNLVFA